MQQVIAAGPVGVDRVCSAVSILLSVPILRGAAAVSVAVVVGQSVGGNGSGG